MNRVVSTYKVPRIEIEGLGGKGAYQMMIWP